MKKSFQKKVNLTYSKAFGYNVSIQLKKIPVKLILIKIVNE